MRIIFIAIAAGLCITGTQALAQYKKTENIMDCDSTCILTNPIMATPMPSVNTTTSTSTQPPKPPTPINGQCGASNNSTLPSSPTSFLCSSGTPTSVTEVIVGSQKQYQWSCNGSNGGTTSSCVAVQKSSGLCPPGYEMRGWDLNSKPATPVCVLIPPPKPTSIQSNGAQVIWDSNLAANTGGNGMYVLSTNPNDNTWYVDGGNGYYGWLVRCNFGYRPRQLAESHNPLIFFCDKQ